MRKKLSPPAALILLLLGFLLGEPPVLNAQSGPSSNPHDPVNGVNTRSQTAARNLPIRTRRVQQDAPISVSSITGESIRQTYTTRIEDLPQITQVAGYTQNGVQTSMNTRFNLRGVGSNPDLTYVNDTRYGQGTGRNMFHSQSVITGQNGIPVYAVEQIEVLKGPQGTLFGRNAVSGVVNFTTNERISSRIKDGVYSSYYMPQSVENYDYSALPSLTLNNWRSTVDAVKLKGEYSTSIPDMTFGPNGTISVKVTLNNDFLIEQQEYRDGNNQLWKVNDIEWYTNDYYNSIKTDYYCGGQQQFTQYSFTDAYGYKNDQLMINFKNSKPDWGYFTPDPAADKSFRQYFNPSSHSFELNTRLPARLGLNDYFYNYTYEQDNEECKEKEDNSCGDNIVSFGISLRLEDFGIEKKAFAGFNGSYTRMFGDVVGGTVDANVNFGKVNDTKYTIGSFYAGPSFFPFSNTLGVHDKISLSAHTLAGYNKVCQKYLDNKFSYGDFSLKLGASLDVNFNCKAGLRFSASDYMVLGDGNTSNNFGFTVGGRFSF